MIFEQKHLKNNNDEFMQIYYFVPLLTDNQAELLPPIRQWHATNF